jgi:hypothetical protein
MTNSDLCFDAWTIRKVANDNFGQEHWHFHDTINYLEGLENQLFANNRDDDDRAIKHIDENDDDFSGNRDG